MESGLGLFGSAAALLVVSEELVAGGAVVLGVSCARVGTASAIASQTRQTSQNPYRGALERGIDLPFGGACNWFVPFADEIHEPDRGSTDSKEDSWGIKLSKRKCNAPERKKYKDIDFESECYKLDVLDGSWMHAK